MTPTMGQIETLSITFDHSPTLGLNRQYCCLVRSIVSEMEGDHPVDTQVNTLPPRRSMG